MLVDKVVITIAAGKGGNGIVSWRHEKHVPKGGPDGGDGGRGGDVIVKSSHNEHTLSAFRYRKVFNADDGNNGLNKQKSGHNGKDLTLLMPLGTIIKAESGSIIADLKEDNQQFIIARGGKGGFGNIHFARSNHQNPFEATQGQPGDVKKITLELSLIADLAFVGLPNAGKTSLIKSLTGVEGRIANYPFSTIDPMLAVLPLGKKKATLIDLPGLIEGAHEGRGLGDKFLQHIQRVKGIVHIIDSTDKDILTSEKTILFEIGNYDEKLMKLPRILVFNKIDLLNKKELNTLKKQYKNALMVSATEETNIDKLKKTISRLV